MGAISIETPVQESDLSGWRGVWVFGERRDGSLHPVAFELLGEGRRLADALGEPLALVVAGEGNNALWPSLAGLPVEHIISIDDARLASFNASPWAAALGDTIAKLRPTILLAGATPLGRSLAPRLAARLRTGLTADCTSLDIDPHEGHLLQTRPAFGGNVMATIVCKNYRPQIATVRPRMLKPLTPTGAPQAEVMQMPINEAWFDGRQRVLQSYSSGGNDASIESADIIVAGGKGLGGPEGFDMLREVAEAIGGTVGASRAAVDAGWIAYSAQVGQTGKTVQPALYIAVGISGSVQHLVGMQSAEAIVAINPDPHAPILSVADYGIVADYRTALPMLKSLLESDPTS